VTQTGQAGRQVELKVLCPMLGIKAGEKVVFVNVGFHVFMPD
jgi:hypothetical protein